MAPSRGVTTIFHRLRAMGIRDRRSRPIAHVCTEKLDSAISVVKPIENRSRDDGTKLSVEPVSSRVRTGLRRDANESENRRSETCARNSHIRGLSCRNVAAEIEISAA